MQEGVYFFRDPSPYRSRSIPDRLGLCSHERLSWVSVEAGRTTILLPIKERRNSIGSCRTTQPTQAHKTTQTETIEVYSVFRYNLVQTFAMKLDNSIESGLDG